MRTLIAGVGAGVLFVGANVAAAEYVPGYPQLAQILPFADSLTDQNARRSAGIPEGDFVPVDDPLTIDGVTAIVLGIYADDLRTAVVVRIEAEGSPTSDYGAPHFGPSFDSVLVAPDGYEYRLQESRGEGSTGGATEMTFAPLRTQDWGAAMELIVSNPRRFGDDLTPEVLWGEWRFPFRIVPGAAPSLPVPGGPIAVGDTSFLVTSIRLSGYQVFVQFEARGGSIQRIVEFNETHPQDWWRTSPGEDADAAGREAMLLGHSMWAWLFDSAGTQLWLSRTSTFTVEPPEGAWPCPCKNVGGVETYYGGQVLTAPGPGHYTLRFARATEAGFEFGDQSGWPITIP